MVQRATSENILDDCKNGVYQADRGVLRTIEKNLPLRWRLAWARYQSARECEPPTKPMNEVAAKAVDALVTDGLYVDQNFMDRDQALSLGERI